MLQAQRALMIQRNNGVTDAVSTSVIDSLSFSADGSVMKVASSGNVVNVDAASIKSLSYGDMPTAFSIKYEGEAVTVVNPYLMSGVTVEAEGANVTVSNSNESKELSFTLSGETTDGSFVYKGTYKTTIVLNGVSITNTKGAAIDIQCGKRVALELKKGTVNTLVDGKDGKQKAALYCKGHLEIDKTGTLNVTGNTKHAISAKEYIQLKKSDGVINILGAVSDGIHCGQYFLAKGYTVNIQNVGGDGIQAEVSGDADYAEDYPDGTVNILNGTFNIEANGEGGVEVTTDDGEEKETPKSYVVYVALTTGTSGGWGGMQGSNYWTTVDLYKSDGTFVANLTNKKTITGTNGQSLTFYYYDFKDADSGSYYFKSADYTSGGGRPGGGSGTAYTIVSTTFTGPTSGIDYYYQISNSYTSSGTTRTFSMSSVQEIYGGGTSDAEGETYYSTGIKADKAVTISDGTITLANSGLMSKSIKAGNSENEGTVTLNGGSVTANISGTMYLNGTDASYCSAVKTDYYVGNGGSLNVTATKGNASRAITADESIVITDGVYTIVNSTNGQTASNDTYTAKALTCDKNITIEGGTFDIKMSGTGGKGIKADGEIIIGKADGSGPSMKVATTGSSLGGGSSQGGGGFPGGGGWGMSSTGSSAKAIKAFGTAYIKGGSLYVTTATDGAEGLESKTAVTISGGTHYFQCYDDCINSAGIVDFAGGTTVCYSNGNDAVDSNYGRAGAITVSGGNIFAYTTKGSPEEGLDCDNNSYIKVTGGIAVSAGGAQGGGSSSSISSSTQGYYLGSSPSSYTSSNYYTLCNTSGTPICTYKFAANVSNSLGLLTASNLGKGSVTVKLGTEKPTACDVNVNDVFFINPTVTTTRTTATITAK